MLRTAATLAITLFLAPQFDAAAQQTTPAKREPPPGEGVLCLWSISNALADYGRACPEVRSAEGQVALEQSAARLDAYVLKNAKEMTPEKLVELKRRHASPGPSAMSCSRATADFYRVMAAKPAELRKATDDLTSRVGEPTWGDCL